MLKGDKCSKDKIGQEKPQDTHGIQSAKRSFRNSNKGRGTAGEVNIKDRHCLSELPGRLLKVAGSLGLLAQAGL